MGHRRSLLLGLLVALFAPQSRGLRVFRPWPRRTASPRFSSRMAVGETETSYADALAETYAPALADALALEPMVRGNSSKVILTVVAPLSAPAEGFRGATWGQVLSLLRQRLAAVDEAYTLEALDAEALETAALREAFGAASIVMLWKVQGAAAAAVAEALDEVDAGGRMKGVLALESSPELMQRTRLGSFVPARPGPLDGWFRKEERATYGLAMDLWTRRSSDDALYLLLLLGHVLAKPVPLIGMALQQADAGAVACMCKHCFKEVVDCVTDPTCKAALDCLDACAANDQVASYKCITTHETPKFTAFSLCVLEKHNCLRKTADAPEPIPAAVGTWRGKPLDDATAEEILVGWLGVEGRQWSWMVHQGQNSAYDQFPNQFQIFHPGKGRGSMWYDPCFQVIISPEERVWRRRHYRVVRNVKLGSGSYVYSVLDNGVTSKEQWRILDAADDLSWLTFFYSGAAKAAGQAYAGSLVCTPDGQPPPAEAAPRIAASLQRAGVQPWEMYTVENNPGAGKIAPLGVEAKAVRRDWLEAARAAGKTIDEIQYQV